MGTLKYDVNNIRFENYIAVRVMKEYKYSYAYNCKRLSFVLVAYILYHLNFAEGL